MVVFVSVIFGGNTYHVTIYEWIVAGDFHVTISFLVDQLTAMLLLVVSTVGFLVHVYSIGYMDGDRGMWRFFAYLNLFMLSMLLLILGDNYLMLYVGWEAVGLCSYALIGFWYKKPSAAGAAKKAFIVNRVGDLGFGLGVMMIWTTFGTLSFSDVFARVQVTGSSIASFVPPPSVLTVTIIALLLFAGAVGKSAQFPLHVWLPDAMEGPTPVSALIHAATMVNAGVYMVARSNPIFAHAPVAMFVVACIGIFTAIFAAAIALTQNDIKKVLAYSTVSQLAYMFTGLGVGAWAAAIFHLVSHGFFKGLLFMGSGSVIHGSGGEQDMRFMGGLREKMRWTYLTMVIGSLALAGIPILAGFFSKDEILGETFSRGYGLFYLVGIVTAFMTAFYTFRMIYMTFWGTWRGPAEVWRHVHESAATMVVPLQILAVPTILVGLLLGIPPGERPDPPVAQPGIRAVGAGGHRRRFAGSNRGRLQLSRHWWAAAAGGCRRWRNRHLARVPLVRRRPGRAGAVRGAHPVRARPGHVRSEREQVLHRRPVPARLRSRRRAPGGGAVVVRRQGHRRRRERCRNAGTGHRARPPAIPDRTRRELRARHGLRPDPRPDRVRRCPPMISRWTRPPQGRWPRADVPPRVIDGGAAGGPRSPLRSRTSGSSGAPSTVPR